MLARLSGNFAVQIFGIVLSFADRFILVGLLLRSLGTDAYSDWVLLLSSAGLLSLGELGLNIYYGNIWQQAHATGNGVRFQRMLGLSLTYSAGLGLALFSIMLLFVAAADLNATLSLKTLPPRQADLVFLLLGAAAASRAMRGGISQLYRGRQAFAVGMLVDLVFVAALFIALLAITLSGGSLPMLAGGYLACDLLAGWGVMMWDLRRRYPDLVFKLRRPCRDEFADLLRHVRWFAVQQGAPVAWLQIPVLLLGWLGVAGPALISFLLLRTLVNFARSLGQMLSISASIELASSFHSGANAEFLRRLGVFGSTLSGIAAAMGIAIFLFGEAIIVVWTGHADLYDPAIAGWLLAAALIAAPGTPLATTLMLCNLPKPAALANLVQISTGLMAVVILGRFYGNLGVAAGLMIGEALAFGLVLPYFAVTPLNLDYPRYLLRCLATMAACALWCGLVGVTLKMLLDPTRLVGLALVFGLWGLFGVIPVLLATLPAAQRLTVLRMSQRLSARLLLVRPL